MYFLDILTLCARAYATGHMATGGCCPNDAVIYQQVAAELSGEASQKSQPAFQITSEVTSPGVDPESQAKRRVSYGSFIFLNDTLDTISDFCGTGS